MKVYKIKKFSDYESEKILRDHGYHIEFNLRLHPEAPYRVFKMKDVKSFFGEKKIGEEVIFSKFFELFNLNSALKFLHVEQVYVLKNYYNKLDHASVQGFLFAELKNGDVVPASFDKNLKILSYIHHEGNEYIRLFIVDPFGKKFNRFEMLLIHDALKIASCGNAKKQADFVEWISMAIAFQSMNGGSKRYEKAYRAYLERLNNIKECN